MKRRAFIKLLGAAAWPIAARAQQAERMRRVGVLLSTTEDREIRLAAFQQALERLGWREGRNVRIDYRFAPAPNADQAQMLAKELVVLQPDVVLAQGTPITAAFQRESTTVPIVFFFVNDPIGSGFITSLARPGGNPTGLTLLEATIAGKWLAMLKEIAPRVTRAALVINPLTSSFAHFAAPFITMLGGAAAACHGTQKFPGWAQVGKRGVCLCPQLAGADIMARRGGFSFWPKPVKSRVKISQRSTPLT